MSDPTRRSVSRRLLGATGMYALAFLTPRILRVAVVPMVVAAVGFETYGKFVMLMLILPFASVICELGMGTAALRLAPDEPPDRRAAMFASMITARAVTSSVAATAIIAARGPLATLTTGSPDASGGVVLVAIRLVLFALVTAFVDQVRSEERHRTLASLTAAREVLEAGLMFALVVVCRGGLTALLVALLVADVAMLASLATTCGNTFRARPTLAWMGTLARLGAPIATVYFLVCLRELDRYLIKAVLGVSDAGRYDLAMRIVGPVDLGNAALSMALEPFAFKLHAAPSASATIGVFLRVYVVLFGTVAFAASAIAPEIFPLLSPGASAKAAVIAPFLIFSFVSNGVLRVAGLGADFAKRTGVWIVVAVAHVLVALPATWFLLRRLGTVSAAVALLAGTLVATEVAYALSRRLFPLVLPIHRALAAIVVGATGITMLVGGAGAVAPLVVRLAAIPMFTAASWALVGLRGGDVAEMFASARVTTRLPGDAPSLQR